MVDPTIRLLELDSRHSELLERLSTLDKQVQEILSDWTQSKEQNESSEKDAENH
ncbi:MAG: hypothetical protein LBB88_12075 [Planctomycetaceae bacterium]|jgi:hypothetical protein|nr:hypothetical protein [Planctomycetaceae bacterium]